MLNSRKCSRTFRAQNETVGTAGKSAAVNGNATLSSPAVSGGMGVNGTATMGKNVKIKKVKKTKTGPKGTTSNGTAEGLSSIESNSTAVAGSNGGNDTAIMGKGLKEGKGVKGEKGASLIEANGTGLSGANGTATLGKRVKVKHTRKTKKGGLGVTISNSTTVTTNTSAVQVKIGKKGTKGSGSAASNGTATTGTATSGTTPANGTMPRTAPRYFRKAFTFAPGKTISISSKLQGI